MAVANAAGWHPWLLAALSSALLLSPADSTAQDASLVAQEAAPPGFGPEDVAAIAGAWPFTDPAFSDGTGTGDREAEARLRALVRDIARAEPAVTPASDGIAEGALDRPPPDTTLWPAIMDADSFPPPVPADPAAWTIEGRPLEALLRLNFAVRSEFAAAARAEDAPPARMFVGRDENMAERASRVLAGRRNAMAAAYAERTGQPVAATLESLAPKAADDAANTGPWIDLSPAVDANAIEVVAALPWELELVILSVVRDMLGGGATTGAVQVGAEVAAGLREPGFDYQGFALTAIGVTRYRVAAGRGNHEAAALLAFEDRAGRQALASLGLRFHVADETFEIDVVTAVAVPVAPQRVATVTVFVPADALDPAAFANDLALVQAVLKYSLDPAAAPKAPTDMLVFAIAAGRMPDDAQLELRIASDGDGIEGYPGRPGMISRHGMRILVHRATFALGAPPAIRFKTVFASGGEQDTGVGAPVLVDIASTHPDAPTVAQ